MIASNDCSAQESKKLGKEIQTLSLPSEISGIAWSPDGKRIAAEGSTRRVVYMWDIENNREIWQAPKVMAGPKQCFLFSKDGKFLIIPSVISVGMSNVDATVSLVSADTGQVVKNLVAELLPNTVNGAASCTLSADGQVVAVLGRSGRVALYETNNWQILGYVGPAQYSNGSALGTLSHIAIDTVQGLLVFAGILGEVQTWDITSNRRLATFRAYDVSGIHSMTLNPATGALVTGGDGNTRPRIPAPGKPLVLEGAPQDDPDTLVRLWDPRTGGSGSVYSGPGIQVNDMAFSSDGRYIAATKGRWIGKKSSYVLVWDASDYKLIATIDCGQAMLNGIEFGPDGRKLAYAADSTIHVIELDKNLFAQSLE